MRTILMYCRITQNLGFNDARMLLVIGLAALLICSIPATAKSTNDDHKADNEWHFVLMPLYLWGVTLDGSTTLSTPEGDSGAYPVDTSELTGAFTFHIEAKKNKWNLFADYLYAEFTSENVTGPLGFVRGENELTVHIAEFGGTYSVIEKHRFELEVLAGVRYLSVKNRFTFERGDLFDPLEGSANIWDGFAGVRFTGKMTESISARARADIGTGDSDMVWNAILTVDWRYNDWGSVYAGYRWLDYDFKEGSGPDEFGINIRGEGPVVGLGFYW